jgi:hypothetical protein
MVCFWNSGAYLDMLRSPEPDEDLQQLVDQFGPPDLVVIDDSKFRLVKED